MPQTPDREAARQQRHRFLGFSFALADLLVEVDATGRIAFAAGACHRLLGMDETALQGQSLLERVEAPHRALVRQVLLQLAAGARIPPVPLSLRRSDGARVEALLGGYALPGEPRHYLVLAEADRFRALAAGGQERDPSTGLHTADGFAERVRQLADAADGSASELTMTLMELQGLDELPPAGTPGSAAEVIDEVAAFLRLRSFEGDSAGWLEEGRFGVVTDGRVDAATLGDELRRAVPLAGRLTASLHSRALLGAGTAPETSARTLIYALRKFQNEGLTPEVCADPATQFRTLLNETLGAIERFQELIDRDRIGLAYQPIIELASGRVHHYEVLARLPDGASPFESVSLGESIGMIPAFDLTICRKALADLELSGRDGALCLAVNLSAQSLQDATFLDSLELLLRRHATVRQRLSFEVTESYEIKDLAAVDGALRRLRGLGCAIALDDFGSGNATFRYLQAFEVDCVKMDGSYVRAMTDSPRDYALVKGMAQICRELGVVLVAEMIETEQQAALLTELGVDHGQGYLFGRPQPSLPHDGDSLRKAPVPRPAPAPPRRAARRQGAQETWM